MTETNQDPLLYNFNVQNEFLNQLRRKQVPVEIHLVSGTSFKGRISQYDNFSIRLNFKGHSEIIYKSAIATIVPVKSIPWGPNAREQDFQGRSHTYKPR